MNHAARRVVSSVLAAVFVIQLAGCGYFLHPNRRGQTGGRVDAGIAVLDGVCCLLFIIPGVIAFAVDFSSGCIYHPGGGRSSLDAGDMKACLFDTKGLTNERLEEIIRAETGVNVRLNDARMRVTQLESLAELPGQLALLGAGPFVLAGASPR